VSRPSQSLGDLFLAEEEAALAAERARVAAMTPEDIAAERARVEERINALAALPDDEEEDEEEEEDEDVEDGDDEEDAP
jgi:hypothetical protein